jgi:hypothetical protein
MARCNIFVNDNIARNPRNGCLERYESYIGRTEGGFKTRYNCHTSSFRLSKYRYATEQSIQLFQLRLSPSKEEKSNTSAKGCWEPH